MAAKDQYRAASYRARPSPLSPPSSSDAAWVGPSGAMQLDPTLVSAGGGISTLDGLIRLDVARALRGGDGWRADFYLNGAF